MSASRAIRNGAARRVPCNPGWSLAAQTWRGMTLIALLLAGSAFSQTVVINEIYYHPPSGDAREEYLELYNRSPEAVNLAGWSFSAGIRFTFPDFTLPAGGFVAIAADTNAFQAKHPDAGAFVGNWTGTLSRGGERLELRNAVGALVHRVSYADQGDWALRLRTFDWMLYPSWDWLAEHDGGGRSLELMDAEREADCGQNWGASLTAGGTPGARNSIARKTTAPFITAVKHAPGVPRASDRVAITARIQGLAGANLTVLLHSTLDGEASSVSNKVFTAHRMMDNGLQGDGQAGDGVYGIYLETQPHGTVVEFYLSAQAEGGEERKWPADPLPVGAPRANLLYQVDDETPEKNLPLYRIVMTEADRAAYLEQVSNQPGLYSNASTSGTFVSVIDGEVQVRYQVGIRNRGNGTRLAKVFNFHVDIPSDQPWEGVDTFHLNGYFPYVQLLGSALGQLAGFASPQSRVVQVHLNGTNLAPSSWPRYGIYVHNEAPNGDYANRHQLGQADVYRCMRDYSGRDPDLSYRGESPDQYWFDYTKETNQSENQWGGLIALLRATDPSFTPDAQYVEELQTRIHATNWVRYFALNTLLVNRETSLGSGVGDDYMMYQDVGTGKFQLVPWDMDTILGQGDTASATNVDLFVATRIPSIQRFLKHPTFAPLYYEQLQGLCNSVFLPERLRELVKRAWGGWVDEAVLEATLRFAEDRRAFVLSQIPSQLTLEHGLPQRNGYAFATNGVVTLWGRADAIQTRSVEVNGVSASWSAWQAQWQANEIPLNPGLNRLVIRSLSASGEELSHQSLDVWFDSLDPVTTPEEIRTHVTWTAAEGPRSVSGTLTIQPEGSLEIGPGVTVYMEESAQILVYGRFSAMGNASGRIRFSRPPGTSARWEGIVFADSSETNCLRSVDLEAGGKTGAVVQVRNSRLLLDQVNWLPDTGTALWFESASLTVDRCRFAGTHLSPTVSGKGIMPGGELVFRHSSWLTTNGSCCLDFSQAQRPGPILQFIDNEISGATSPALRLQEADAHLEGNVFRGDATSTCVEVLGSTNHRPHVVLANSWLVGWNTGVVLDAGASVTLHNDTFNEITGAAVVRTSPTLSVAGLSSANIVNTLFRRVGSVFQGFTGVSSAGALSVNWSLFDQTPTETGEGNLQGDARLAWKGKWLLPGAGSATLSQGLYGLDIGATVVPQFAFGLSVVSPTPSRRMELPLWGPGLMAYQASVDGASFGPTQALGASIVATNLTDGEHRVRVRVQNSAGVWLEVTEPMEFSWRVEPGASPLLLSEVKAASRLPGTDPANSDGWVELYNRGDQTMDLQGMGISDQPYNPYRHRFGSGRTLAAGNFLVVHSSELGFRIAPSGETLSLFSSLETGGQKLDEVIFGPQLEAMTIARAQEGDWRLAQPTPSEANRAYPVGDPANLCINEILTRGPSSGSGAFVELYNRDLLPVALHPLHLSDYPSSAPARQSFPPLSFIEGHGWLALGESAGGLSLSLPLEFKPTSSQGVLAILDEEGRAIDIVWYPSQRSGIALGRVPDGGDPLLELRFPVAGGPNADVLSPQVVLNEVLADNRSARLANGYDGDWIELRNTGATELNLAEMSLSDDPSLPRMYVFPANTTLPAHGFLVIACDPNQPVSRTNTGFGLNRAGDALFLFRAPAQGGGLCDTVTFGFQAPDLSFARPPGGGTTWGPTVPTPAAENPPSILGDLQRVVVNEWMARPQTASDWFELYNPGPAPVDLGGCYLTDDPSDPYKFQIPAHSFLSTNVFAYRQILADNNATYAADQVPFQLSAGGEWIQLRDPDGLLIHEVQFGPQANGVSEGRIPDGQVGISAFPGSPTPGRANFQDGDQDGMADAWELEYGLHPTLPQDALEDPDEDGLTNLAEYLAGTDPQDAASNLSLRHLPSGTEFMEFEFVARAGKNYAIESKESLSGSTWTLLQVRRIGSQDELVYVRIPLLSTTAQQFVRLRME